MLIQIKKTAEEAGSISDLSGPQTSALLVLASGGRKSEAARAAGVHPQRLSEWLRGPHFRDALAEAREELITQAGHELRLLTVESVATLRNLLRNSPPGTQFRTAAFVLDHVLRLGHEGYVDGDCEPDGEIEIPRLLNALGLVS